MFSSSSGSAKLSLSISGWRSQAIKPEGEIEPASYEIVGLGPGSTRFMKSISSAQGNFDGLVSGAWTVSVNAKDASSNLIGTGIAGINLTAGLESSLNVNMQPKAGTGRLEVGVSWPQSKVASPSISARLIPVTGSSIEEAFSLGSGTASFSGPVPAGNYALCVALLDGGKPAMSEVAFVRIADGLASKGSLDFSGADAAAPSYRLQSDTGTAATVAVSISGGSTALASDSSMSLSPSNVSGNLVYAWSLDGKIVGFGDSRVFGGSALPLAQGQHRAGLVALIPDGSGGGSSALDFLVSDVPLGAVTHGKDLNETNTGVPAGRVLRDAGSGIVVTEAWISSSNGGKRYIEDRNFLSGAGVQVKTGNFTVRYCRFNGKSGGSVDIGLTGVVFEYCEFDGQNLNVGDSTALGIGGLTARRLHIHRWPRAFWFGWGNVDVEECYVHDVTADGGTAHLENIYVAGGTHQVYLRNKLITNEVHINGDSRMMTSASLAIYNEPSFTTPAFSALTDIVVKDNYLESDGYYAMYGGALKNKTGAYATGMTVTGNIFGRGLHRTCGVAGAVVAFDPSQPGNSWTGNVWGPKGAGFQSGDPAEGAPVLAPGPM